jgi:hypothetical protein
MTLQKDPRLETAYILSGHFIVPKTRESDHFFCILSKLIVNPHLLITLLSTSPKSSITTYSPAAHKNNEIIIVVYHSPSYFVYHFQCGDCDCLLVHHVDEHGRSISSGETKHVPCSAKWSHPFSMPAVCKLIQ